MALIARPDHDKENEYKKRKKRMENIDVVRYTVRIPTHIHTKLKTRLIAKRRSMKDFFIEQIIKFLDEK